MFPFYSSFLTFRFIYDHEKIEVYVETKLKTLWPVKIRIKGAKP